MSEWVPCHLCGGTAAHRHHVFYGTANRKVSEEYGYVVFLCLRCHEYVHRTNEITLKQEFQKRFEETDTRAEFIRIFGRSYL